jgi:hypothetical protein
MKEELETVWPISMNYRSIRPGKKPKTISQKRTARQREVYCFFIAQFNYTLPLACII